jgi:hypothetical protein
MSKSKKHTPISSNGSVTHGQKAFRSQENRAKRKKVKQLLKVNHESELPDEKEYGNEWNSPRGGKHWLTKDIWKKQGYRYNIWIKK